MSIHGVHSRSPEMLARRRRSLICGVLALGVGAANAQSNSAPLTSTPAQVAVNQVPADVQKALEMPKGADGNKALIAAAVAWAKTDPTAALAWLLQLPQDTAGPILFPVTATCGHSNGKLSADWLLRQGDLRSLSRLHALIWAWASVDPAGATAWCAQSPKNVRYLAFYSAGDGWGGRTDAAAGADWAAKLAAPDDRAPAIRGVAQSRSLKDAAATTAWIKALPHDDMMTAAKSVVATRRAFDKNNPSGIDPAIKAWLDQLPLSEPEKDAVTKDTPINIYKTLTPIAPVSK